MLSGHFYARRSRMKLNWVPSAYSRYRSGMRACGPRPAGGTGTTHMETKSLLCLHCRAGLILQKGEEKNVLHFFEVDLLLSPYFCQLCPGGLPFRWALLGISEHGSPPQRISHGVQVGTLMLRGLYFERIPESLSAMRNFRAICRRWCAVASAVSGLIPAGGNKAGRLPPVKAGRNTDRKQLRHDGEPRRTSLCLCEREAESPPTDFESRKDAIL